MTTLNAYAVQYFKIKVQVSYCAFPFFSFSLAEFHVICKVSLLSHDPSMVPTYNCEVQYRLVTIDPCQFRWPWEAGCEGSDFQADYCACTVWPRTTKFGRITQFGRDVFLGNQPPPIPRGGGYIDFKILELHTYTRTVWPSYVPHPTGTEPQHSPILRSTYLFLALLT